MDSRHAIEEALAAGTLQPEEIPWAEQIIERHGLGVFTTLVEMWAVYEFQQRIRRMHGIFLDDFSGLR